MAEGPKKLEALPTHVVGMLVVLCTCSHLVLGQLEAHQLVGKVEVQALVADRALLRAISILIPLLPSVVLLFLSHHLLHHVLCCPLGFLQEGDGDQAGLGSSCSQAMRSTTSLLANEASMSNWLSVWVSMCLCSSSQHLNHPLYMYGW